jgi:hypothetical protein
MKSVTLFLFSIFFSYNFAFARQGTKDYYVTLQNDTVCGEFISSSSIKIKSRLDETKLILKPKDFYR